MNLKSLLVFVRVAELRSFTRAATDLRMTTSGVSNAINRLESEVGAMLVARTTRSVGLTEDGEAFFLRCRQALGDLEEAKLVLQKMHLVPAGRLRLSLPVSFGRLKVVPLLGAFQSMYPGIEVHVGITDRYVDLIDEGIDVAVRFGQLPNSTLIARKLLHVRRRVVGTPEYFSRCGKPRTIADLASHNCLALTYHETREVRRWAFRHNARQEFILPKGTMSFNDGTALSAAVLASFGLGQIHDYYVDEAIARGLLVPVLEKFRPAPDPVSVVYAPTRHLTPKVRSFVDFLASNLSRPNPSGRVEQIGYRDEEQSLGPNSP